MRVLAIVVLAGCIEGPEPDSVDNLTPRQCETGLAADQTFTITGRYELARQQRLVDDPPRFALDGPTGVIGLTTTVGAYGEMTLVPEQPLPANADLSLRMTALGALDGVYITPGLFPLAYSTRASTVIRSYRAVDNNIFISFSQPLDAATVDGAILVKRGTNPVTAAVQYLDAPGHVVHVQLYDQGGAVDVQVTPALRTELGTQVFEVTQSVQLDPSYTVPADNGCRYAEST